MYNITEIRRNGGTDMNCILRKWQFSDAKDLASALNNIKIINNRFNSYKGYAVLAKSSDDILISDNKFLSDKILKSVNCGNVTLKNNDTV